MAAYRAEGDDEADEADHLCHLLNQWDPPHFEHLPRQRDHLWLVAVAQLVVDKPH